MAVAVGKSWQLADRGDGRGDMLPPPPGDLTGISFDWANKRELAGPDGYAGGGSSGTDNWPAVWSATGTQWLHAGDGGSFSNGVNSTLKNSWIFAKIDGDDYQTAVGTNLRGGINPTFGPPPFDGKSQGGGFEVNGVIYYWWGPGSGGSAFNQTRLVRSLDGGDTWEQSSWDLTNSSDRLIKGGFCQAGQGNVGAGTWAKDEYIYTFFPRRQGGAQDLQIMDTGIELCRCLPANIWNDPGGGTWEWWTGSAWDPDVNNRGYVFTDPLGRGVGWCLSAAYLQPQQRYILITEHTESFRGNIDFWQSPAPTGPWTRFANFGVGGSEYFGQSGGYNARAFMCNISAKWLNGDSGVLIYTGIEDVDLMGMVPFTLTRS